MQITQEDAEHRLIYSLLVHTNESSEDTLNRVATIPLDMPAEEISDPQLRALFLDIMRNADEGMATSPALAASISGIDAFDIAAGMAATDPNALAVYCKALAMYSDQRAIRKATEKMTTLAKGDDPHHAANAIANEIASVALSDDTNRVGSIAERIDTGGTAFRARQQLYITGAPTLSFAQVELNHKIPGILPGEMVLLTAQSKMGKSSWLGELFDRNLLRGLRGILFHFEDSSQVMYMRRIARHMQARHADGLMHVTWSRLRGLDDSGTTNVALSKLEMQAVEQVETQIAMRYTDRGLEVYCAGWTMGDVVRTWRRLELRAKAQGSHYDFVIVDYLNKAEIDMRLATAMGYAAARGHDVEILKQTAEGTGTICILAQQENMEGTPFETKQSWQKSQAWLTIFRDRDNFTKRIKLEGLITVNSANAGETGSSYIRLDPRWMVWPDSAP